MSKEHHPSGAKQAWSRGLWEVHAAVLLFGLAGLFGDWVGLPAAWIVLGRTGFAALFLMVLLSAVRISYRPDSSWDAFLLFLSGALLAFHWVAFFQSIQLSSVALGLLTFSSFPVFTVLLEPWFGQGQVTRQNLLVAFITMLGVGLVMPPLDLALKDTQGALWGLASGLSFALLALVNRGLVTRNPGPRIAFWQNVCAFGCLLPVPWWLPQRPSLGDWGLLLLLGILFTGVSHSLFIDGLKQIPARTASVIATLEPVYGIIAAFFWLGQRPELLTLLGGALIVGSSVYASVKR